MLPETQLQFPRRFLGEGHGDDLANVGAPFGEYAHDPAHELGRLARAGGGLDDECLVDRVVNELTRARVREWIAGVPKVEEV